LLPELIEDMEKTRRSLLENNLSIEWKEVHPWQKDIDPK